MESQSHTLDSEPVAHPQSQQADTLTDQELTQRYSSAISELVEDAFRRGKPRLVVDALTWHIACLVAHCGPGAAGHIFERLGAHTTYLADRAQAESEAERARQEGHKPN